VKVVFHWLPATPSCWIRTSQLWASAGWGNMAIPRIGDEVVVAFEDGDPDRPLIVGSVYNGASGPPYDPVAERTVTTFKTNSSPGGGGFNELRFTDKAGEEGVVLHAQRDHDRHVRNTDRTSIGNDRHLTVGNKAFSEIVEDSHASVSGDGVGDIDGNQHSKMYADARLCRSQPEGMDLIRDNQEAL
jgi:type VI secretion system secreted protein VgrG